VNVIHAAACGQEKLGEGATFFNRWGYQQVRRNKLMKGCEEAEENDQITK
jgi:hypothetical protein